MRSREEMSIRARVRSVAAVLGMMVVGLALGAMSPACQAAQAAMSDPGLAAPGPGVPMILANAIVLSDSAMAQQVGEGLQAPAIGNASVARPPVLLWDELKPSPPSSASAASGTVTVTVIAPGK